MYLIAITGKPRRDGSRRRYPNFVCRQSYEPVKCEVRPSVLSAGKLEAAVRACLLTDLTAAESLTAAIARAQAAAGGDATLRARQALDDRRRIATHRHERARERWLAGREPLAWMDYEDERYQTAMAEIEVGLAHLPAPPDPARYAELATALGSLGALLAHASGEALRHVLDEVGIALVDGVGVRICYHPGYRDFVPAPVFITP
jgi:hypothetical protein